MDLTTIVRVLQIYGATALCGGIVVAMLLPGEGHDRSPGTRSTIRLAVTLGTTVLVIGCVLDLQRLAVALFDVQRDSIREIWSAMGVVARGTTYGRWTAVKAIAAVVLHTICLAKNRTGRVGIYIWLFVILLGLTFGWTGHAVSGLLPIVTVPLQSIHTLVAFTWFGGIMLMVALIWSHGWQELRFPVLLGRFSRLGLITMALLVFSGTIVALLRLTSPEALWTTPYGRTLTVKLLWMASVLMLAGVHRFVLLPRWQRSGVNHGEALSIARITLTLEAAMGAMVLWYAVSLATTPPP